MKRLPRANRFMTPEQYDEAVRQRLRAWTKETETGCWEYTGFIHWNGYGGTGYRGKTMRAHKLTYILYKGSVPDGYDVCHSCDNRKCINPDHLWIGTRQQNVDDMTAKRRHANTIKTACKNGHLYVEGSYFINCNGKRVCGICNRARYRIRNGWPRDLAFSVPPVPKGYRVNKRAIHNTGAE